MARTTGLPVLNRAKKEKENRTTYHIILCGQRHESRAKKFKVERAKLRDQPGRSEPAISFAIQLCSDPSSAFLCLFSRVCGSGPLLTWLRPLSWLRAAAESIGKRVKRKKRKRNRNRKPKIQKPKYPRSSVRVKFFNQQNFQVSVRWQKKRKYFTEIQRAQLSSTEVHIVIKNICQIL